MSSFLQRTSCQNACPRFAHQQSRPRKKDATEPLLVVDNVTAGYGSNHQYLALHSVSIEAHAGRTIGIIGESGSGKTTLGRVISGLMGCKQGQVRLGGMPLAGSIGARSRDELRSIQFAFQMADVALNPRHRIRKILGRPLKFYFKMSKGEADHRVDELLDTVELPASFADRFSARALGWRATAHQSGPLPDRRT